MRFDFNIYSSLLLPPFIQAIIFAGLLLYRGWREEKLSDRILGFILLLNAIKIAFWMLGFAGWYETHDGLTSFMFYFPFNNIILIGPLLYFYFLSLTNAEFHFEKKHRVHLLIPVLWIIFIVSKLIIDYTFYYPFPVSEENQFGTKGPFAESDKKFLAGFISYVVFFYYLYLTLKEYKSYKKYIKENFSDNEEISFSWLRNILYAIIIGVLIIFLFNMIELIRGTSYVFDWYSYLFLGLATYYLSISGYFTQPRVLHKLNFIPEKSLPGTIQKEDTRTDPEKNEWKEKLLIHMREKKPYLKASLSLGELANQLNTNTSVLSKVINDGTGRNFNDFINSYRIQETIEKLKRGEHQSQTLLGIAYDCGFNSKATFNRSFKKITGVSPKEWLHNNK
ncbi:MAG TPA: helix-turn-helix domain-containing protein [Chitinophagaceae bacterium]|nr:helix-turn-helix domain-containing protein [Chitinophagaceae bacterium]